MLRLAIDSSTKTAAAALERDGRVIGESFCNNGLTHSQTLLPAVEQILTEAGVDYGELDGIVVTIGPGSFTGVRIGVSTAKGIAMGAGIPITGVSSLAAAAGVFSGESGEALICPCFDARCGQVYHAMFALSQGVVTRQSADCALTIAELAEKIRRSALPVWVCGDGAELVCGQCPEAVLAPEKLRYITGKGIFCAAQDVPACDFKDIVPSYLRLSQAQRERENKLKNEK